MVLPNVSLGVCSFIVYFGALLYHSVSGLLYLHSMSSFKDSSFDLEINPSCFLIQIWSFNVLWLMFYRHSVFSNPGHENSRRGGDPTNVEVATSAWRETRQTSGCSDWPADQCEFGNTESRRWIGIHGWGTGRLLGFGQDVSSWHWSDRFKCACLNVKLLYINLMAKKLRIDPWNSICDETTVLNFYHDKNQNDEILDVGWEKYSWKETPGPGLCCVPNGKADGGPPWGDGFHMSPKDTLFRYQSRWCHWPN